jgi:release factor glutamine methyltransferase
VTRAARLLAEARVERADAEFLLMALLGLPRHRLHEPDCAVADHTARAFRDLVARCAAGEPPQYLVNSAPFLDFDVYVDPRVLIPRPETEQLVARVLELARAPGLVLDFGTGSGCICAALLRALPGCRAIAVDASADALEVARLNFDRLGVSSRVEAVHCDALDHPRLAALRGTIDLLAGNPPYVPSARIAELEPRVRDHEPRAALDGGPDGTNILAMLLEQGPAMLRPGGLLALEIDATHADRLLRLAPAAAVENDLAGRPRFLFLRREAR